MPSFGRFEGGDLGDRGAGDVVGGGVIGPFSSQEAVEAAIPAADADGALAIVGTGAPYDLYESDGSVWRVRGSKPKVQDFGATSGNRSINCAKGTICALTITGPTTLSFTNGPSFNSVIRLLLQITNGGSNVTWPAGTRWVGAGVVGSAPALAPTGTEKIAVEIINIAGTVVIDAAYIGRVA